MLLLIYYPAEPTARMQYVLEWICKEQLQLDYQITQDRDSWLRFKGPRINYSSEALRGRLRIIPEGLLEEKGSIRPRPLAVQRWKKTTVLFYNQPGAQVPFDLFSAVFYLISRYEEYLPHTKDRHGRFPPEASVAAGFRFLQEPVVDQWLHFLGMLLEQEFGIALPQKSFQWQVSFDVDMAWKYLNKGAFRYFGAQGRDLLLGKWKNVQERNAVLSGKRHDPFFSFPELDVLHQQHKIRPVYFILLGKPGAFDRNADPGSRSMKNLMRLLSDKYPLGIHPSYGSHTDPGRLAREMELLSDCIQKPVTLSRQHFIKFSLPDTYRELIRAGIREDYSMGYAACNGFRAGTSHAFTWYDLQAECTRPLRIHPFAFMDATSVYYTGQCPEETLKEWKRIWTRLQQVKGNFVSIWHNFILQKGSPWLALYGKILQEADPQSEAPAGLLSV